MTAERKNRVGKEAQGSFKTSPLDILAEMKRVGKKGKNKLALRAKHGEFQISTNIGGGGSPGKLEKQKGLGGRGARLDCN